jgi:hypothetical protein
VETTKSGSYVYHGEAANYHEWEFRTRLRLRAAGKDDPEKYAEAMSKVVEGLRGDAFIIAKEVGLDRIWCPGDELQPEAGVDTLIKAVRLSVFPLTTHEAKELFRQYCKPSGTLSRQAGESMHQYTSRRRRCWKLLKELDPEIMLSEGHRADMLLDLAGLDVNQRTMIQASIGNARDFEKIAEALVMQHPRIHLKDHKPKGIKGAGKGKSFGKTRKGNKFRKGKFARQANLASEEWYPAETDEAAFLAEEEPYNDPAYYEEDEDAEAFYAEDGDEPLPDEWNSWTAEELSAYVAEEWQKQWEADDALEAAELECVACLYQVLGPNCMDDPEACSCFIQDGATAFLANKSGKKGSGKRGKGKYPVRPSNLTIEDRRKKLKELKAKTECKDCGRRGHWKGDK